MGTCSKRIKGRGTGETLGNTGVCPLGSGYVKCEISAAVRSNQLPDPQQCKFISKAIPSEKSWRKNQRQNTVI